MKRSIRSGIVAVTLLSVVGVAAAGCFQTKRGCSPCPPGTGASHPDEYCSACVPIDGGTDGRQDSGDGATSSTVGGG